VRALLRPTSGVSTPCRRTTIATGTRPQLTTVRNLWQRHADQLTRHLLRRIDGDEPSSMIKAGRAERPPVRLTGTDTLRSQPRASAGPAEEVFHRRQFPAADHTVGMQQAVRAPVAALNYLDRHRPSGVASAPSAMTATGDGGCSRPVRLREVRWVAADTTSDGAVQARLSPGCCPRWYHRARWRPLAGEHLWLRRGGRRCR
jgi:hypothetical protein